MRFLREKGIGAWVGAMEALWWMLWASRALGVNFTEGYLMIFVYV